MIYIVRNFFEKLWHVVTRARPQRTTVVEFLQDKADRCVTIAVFVSNPRIESRQQLVVACFGNSWTHSLM